MRALRRCRRAVSAALAGATRSVFWAGPAGPGGSGRGACRSCRVIDRSTDGIFDAYVSAPIRRKVGWLARKTGENERQFFMLTDGIVDGNPDGNEPCPVVPERGLRETLLV